MENIQQVLNAIRNNSPLVHNITNYVVMNNTANALLSVGASPVMAHAIEEVEDIVNISSSLVINMGTLSDQWVKSMLLAARKAKASKTPFVFDPVGVGASRYRTQSAQKIINAASPSIIRGNASEIIALAGISNTTKGVDSTVEGNLALGAARQLSKQLDNTIIVSGATDYIITNDQITTVTNGDPLMAKVTGMGCTSTAIVGACAAVTQDIHLAATAGMAIMGVAGSIAANEVKGPGSFQVAFLDALYTLSDDWLKEYAKLSTLEYV